MNDIIIAIGLLLAWVGMAMTIHWSMHNALKSWLWFGFTLAVCGTAIVLRGIQ